MRLQLSSIIIIIITIVLVYQIIVGLCLVCYCEHSRLCVGDEDICEGVNDVCFTRIRANRTYEYACLGVENDSFYSIVVNNCLGNKYSKGFEGLICCNDRDRCNEDLRPPPPSKQSVTMEALAGSGADKTRGHSQTTLLYIGCSRLVDCIGGHKFWLTTFGCQSSHTH